MLETAVLKVIGNNKNIFREPEVSQEYKDIYKEVIKERNKANKNVMIDTNYVDYYNEGGISPSKLKHRTRKINIRLDFMLMSKSGRLPRLQRFSSPMRMINTIEVEVRPRGKPTLYF